MRFETRDREYTAQILKRDKTTYDFGGTSRIGWRVCGNTTFIVHGDPKRPTPMFDYEAWERQKEAIRHPMLYGAGLSRPKIPPLTF